MESPEWQGTATKSVPTKSGRERQLFSLRRWSDSTGQFDPFFVLRRPQRRVDDRLGADTVMEAGAAGALAADGVDELPRLIVAEGDQGVALLRVSWRPGPAPEFFGNGDRFQAGAASRAGLQLVPLPCDEDERTLAAVEFHIIEAPPAFVAARGELAALEYAGGVALKLSQDCDPILQVARCPLPVVVPNPGVRHEAFDWPYQEMGEVDAMAEHVAQFASPGQLPDLAPSQLTRSPILESAGTVMVRLAQIAALEEMGEITHRRHETVGEGRHVPHAGFVGGFGDLFRLHPVHGDGLFTEHMLAGRNGGQRNRGVGKVGRRDDDGMDVFPTHDLLVLGRSDLHPGLLSGPLERRWIAVAECDHPGVRAQRQTREMILQSHAAAADDRNADGFHGIVKWLTG